MGNTRVVAMLVLSRKVGEKILIGDKIVVTVVKVCKGRVSLGIDAPAELTILRAELDPKPKPEDRPKAA